MSRQTPEHTTLPHPATTGIIFLTVGEEQEQETHQNQKKKASEFRYLICVFSFDFALALDFGQHKRE